MNCSLLVIFQKKSCYAPELNARHVTHIRSVSNCISCGPENLVEKWLHNDWRLYSSAVLALDIVNEAERNQYEMHAYRILPMECDHGRAQPFVVPTFEVEKLPKDFVSIVFDAVSRDFCHSFEHSPFSCNYMAAEIKTNEHCLLDDL
jgi:hypothetical protein